MNVLAAPKDSFKPIRKPKSEFNNDNVFLHKTISKDTNRMLKSGFPKPNVSKSFLRYAYQSQHLKPKQPIVHSKHTLHVFHV